MLNLEELLEPIPGENPSGKDLRYAPVSAQVREARRVEEDLEQGVWKREIKKADYGLVTRLATEALTKQGKDLQVAAWLTEAAIHASGYQGLRQGLELIRGLLEQYWDTVYPAIDEDGDLELRATPMMWVASQLDRVIRSIPLTAGGYTWLDYHSAKSVPTEEEAARDDTKRALRQEAIDHNRPTAEAFEEACGDTPIAFYETLQQDLASAGAQLEALATLADEKFGDASPGFGRLRELLEEMAQTARVILVKRRQSVAAPAVPAAPPPPPRRTQSLPVDDWGDPIPAAAPAVDSWEQPPSWEQPSWPAPEAGAATDPQDSIRLVAEVAASLRQRDSHSPVPYLLLRAARWGELYAAGDSPDFSLLETPPTANRVELKRLWQAGDWEALLETAETAMGLPCGRAWLDLQRYSIRAAENTGREAVARALRSNLGTLLRDYPKMPDWSLNDDTPAASPETREWLRQERLGEGGHARPFESHTVEVDHARSPSTSGEDVPPVHDAFDLAMEAARAGRAEEALSILSREAAQESSGRGRFLRKVQLAQVCLVTRNESVGAPILEQLSEEIERRQLEDWEAPEVIAQPLAMLVRCLDQSAGDPEWRKKLYSRICRLDPARALSLAR